MPVSTGKKYVPKKGYKKRAVPKSYANKMVAFPFPFSSQKYNTRSFEYKSVPRGPKITRAYAMSYMSPFGKTEAPSNSNSLGNFTTVLAQKSYSFTTSAAAVAAKLVVFQPSNRGVYSLGNWAVDTGLNLDDAPPASPNYKFVSAPPLSCKVLRAGLRISNTTKRDSVAGTVRVLVRSSPLSFEGNFVGATWDISAAFAAILAAEVRESSKTVTYSAAEFLNTKEFVLSPATMSSYNSYGQARFNYGITEADFQDQFTLGEFDMSMCTIIMLFESTPSGVNTYDATFAIQNGFRYPSGSTLAGLAKTAPSYHGTFNENYINRIVMENVAAAMSVQPGAAAPPPPAKSQTPPT